VFGQRWCLVVWRRQTVPADAVARWK